MNRFHRFTGLGISAVLIVGFLPAGRSLAQTKPPVRPLPTPYPGEIRPTPWFANPDVRDKFKLKDSEYNEMAKAYQQAYTQYGTGINSLEKQLTDEERNARLSELQKHFRESYGEAVLRTLTDPLDRHRFYQLDWQYRGYDAFQDPRVVSALKLSLEQRQIFKDLALEWNMLLSKLTPIYRAEREEVTRRLVKMQAQATGRIGEVLTPAQQLAWRQLIGEPYTFPSNVYFAVPPTTNAPRQ